MLIKYSNFHLCTTLDAIHTVVCVYFPHTCNYFKCEIISNWLPFADVLFKDFQHKMIINDLP